MRNQKGFTLIELIIVIVVLGILAVTAAPQFIDFSKDARVSAINGLKGSLQGASQTVYGRAAIEGLLTDGDATTTEGSYGVVYGYPSVDGADDGNVDDDGIIKAAGLGSTDDDWTWYISGNDTIAITLTSYAEGNSLTDYSGVTGSNCYAEYTEAKNTSSPVDANQTTEPQISSTTSGC